MVPRITPVLTVAVTLFGCGLLDMSVPRGQDFKLEEARAIKDGETTKEEVKAKFGDPGSVTSSGDNEIWTYAYERVVAGRQKTWSSGRTTRTETTVTYRKMLVVMFDTKGIVQHHQVSEEGKP